MRSNLWFTLLFFLSSSFSQSLFFFQRIRRLISPILKVASIYPLNAFGLWEEAGDCTQTQGDPMLMVWRCSKVPSVVTLMRHCSFLKLALTSSLTPILGRLRINSLLFRNGGGDISGDVTHRLGWHIKHSWSCLSLAGIVLECEDESYHLTIDDRFYKKVNKTCFSHSFLRVHPGGLAATTTSDPADGRFLDPSSSLTSSHKL